MIRGISIMLVTVLVAGATRLYGLPGTAIALPVAILISIATERWIARHRPSQAAVRRRLP